MDNSADSGWGGRFAGGRRGKAVRQNGPAIVTTNDVLSVCPSVCLSVCHTRMFPKLSDIDICLLLDPNANTLCFKKIHVSTSLSYRRRRSHVDFLRHSVEMAVSAVGFATFDHLGRFFRSKLSRGPAIVSSHRGRYIGLIKNALRRGSWCYCVIGLLLEQLW